MDSKKLIKLPIAIAAGAALAISSAILSSWFLAPDKSINPPSAVADNAIPGERQPGSGNSIPTAEETEPRRLVVDKNVIPVDHPQATADVAPPASLQNLEYVSFDGAENRAPQTPPLPTRLPNQVERTKETTRLANEFPLRSNGWPPVTRTTPQPINDDAGVGNTTPQIDWTDQLSDVATVAVATAPVATAPVAPQPTLPAEASGAIQKAGDATQATAQANDNSDQLNELARQIALLREQLSKKESLPTDPATAQSKPVQTETAQTATAETEAAKTEAAETEAAETEAAKTEAAQLEQVHLEIAPANPAGSQSIEQKSATSAAGNETAAIRTKTGLTKTGLTKTGLTKTGLTKTGPTNNEDVSERTIITNSEARKNDSNRGVIPQDLTLERDTWLGDDSWEERRPEAQPLAQPYASQTGGLNYHALNAISKEAEVHNQRAINLASRAAYYSARAEFLESLKTVARGLDLQRGSRAHTVALAQAFRAIKEADHFAPQEGSIDREDSIQFIIDSHRTPILQNVRLSGMLPSLAIQAYYNFAEERIAFACGGMPVAAQSLYGLGRIYSELCEHPGQVVTIRATVTFKTLLFHKSALAVQPSHYQAANELGVLLCRRGQLQAAHAALSHSLAISSQPETRHNLTVVQNRMRQLQIPAEQQFRNTAPQFSQPPANGRVRAVGNLPPNNAMANVAPNSEKPAVQFVTVNQFRQSFRAPQANSGVAPQYTQQPQYPQASAAPTTPPMNYPYHGPPQAMPQQSGAQYIARPIPANEHPASQPSGAWWQFWNR